MAQDHASGQTPGQPSDFLFTVGPRIWGAEGGIGYRGMQFFDGLDTTLWLKAGAAWQPRDYYRLPDGTMVSGGEPDSVTGGRTSTYNAVTSNVDLGIHQGLIYNPAQERNLVELFLYLRGYYDYYYAPSGDEPLLFATSLSDKRGIFQSSLLGGFRYTTATYHQSSRVRSGSVAEVSSEWAPGVWPNGVYGEASYLRLNAQAAGYLPIFESSAANGAGYGLYAALYGSLDYSTGSHIPLNILQTFGGLSTRTGLGGSVRGVDDRRFAANFKGVANFDLRLEFPALADGLLESGIVTFVDGGFFDDTQNISPVRSDHSGTAWSTGIGVSGGIRNLATLVIYTEFYVNGTNIDGTAWTPIGLGFGLHF